MKNLSEDERRDIDDLLGDIVPEKKDDLPEESDNPINGSNGEAVLEETTSSSTSLPIEEDSLSLNVSSKDFINLITLQNDRLAILNKKVDVLTRLVELILRANLEDVD